MLKEQNGGTTRLEIENMLYKLAHDAMPENLKDVPPFDKRSGSQPHVQLPLSGLLIASRSQEQARYYKEKLGGQIIRIAQTSGSPKTAPATARAK